MMSPHHTKKLSQSQQRRGSHKRTKLNHRRLLLEHLEQRYLLATFDVNTTVDSVDASPGDGFALDAEGRTSLRAAVMEANAWSGADVIKFQIPGDGPHTIRPNSPLPIITESIVIDAWANPGCSNTPSIELNGEAAGLSHGLHLAADNSLIRGLAINRFSLNGITVDEGDDNVIEGNFIGTDVTGMIALGNGGNGVEIMGGASGNRIGSNGDSVCDAAEPNIISGNLVHGVSILDHGTSRNVVAGNFIGVNALGSGAVSNNGSGVAVHAGHHNIIGTNGDGVGDDSEGNLVSGNLEFGVQIGFGAAENTVAGNKIGTTLDGMTALANGLNGVFLYQGAFANTIGTNGDGLSDHLEGNVISGNAYAGVNIYSEGTSHNILAGNFIGVDANAETALPNGDHGVYVANGASLNRIGTDGNGIADEWERNVISGNAAHGINITGTGSDENVVAGNFIGTDQLGTTSVPNAREGVLISGGAKFNRIGVQGSSPNPVAERNVISGNALSGIFLSGAGTDHNLVAGNLIGTDPLGTGSLGNTRDGIAIHAGRYNIIGTNGDGVGDHSEGNLVSGNGNFGIQIGLGAAENTVAGNKIGTTLNGMAALANGLNGVFLFQGAFANTIGTNGDGLSDYLEGNVISGNAYAGVNVNNAGTSHNILAGNLIGVDANGEAAIPNGDHGVYVANGASLNRIGTDGNGVADEWERNIISGNAAHGVNITGAGSNGNVVAGNFIGTDQLGTSSVPNALEGVLISGGAKFNRIGVEGDSLNPLAERNVISGNAHSGIFLNGTGTDHNVVAGNFVGTNSLGQEDLGNTFNGIAIHTGRYNIIGTNGDGVGDEYEGNVASGNGHSGVLLAYDASFNRIAGNRIGTTKDGLLPLQNGQNGVLLYAGAHSNYIGTNGDGQSDGLEANVISGNKKQRRVCIGRGHEQQRICRELDWSRCQGRSSDSKRQRCDS